MMQVEPWGNQRWADDAAAAWAAGAGTLGHGADLMADLQPGRLTLVRGQSGSGKSALALAISYLAGRRNGKHIGWISLELTREELLFRLLALETGRESRMWRTGSGELEPERLLEVRGVFRDLRFSVCDRIEPVELMAEKIKNWHRKEPMDIVVIDYLELLPSGWGAGWVKQGEERVAMVKVMRQLVDDLGCAMMVIGQDGREYNDEMEGNAYSRSRRNVEDHIDEEWTVERNKREGVLYVRKKSTKGGKERVFMFPFCERTGNVIIE